MSTESFDRDAWEERWAGVLRDHPEAVANRPPNAHLVQAYADTPAGRALDAGCGHGAESIWLAARGWRVQAVDFSTTALGIARSTAESIGSDVAERIEWLEGDLGTWAPEPASFDLVSCLYVHVAGSVAELVSRLGGGVVPGGSLFLVGHLPVDPETGGPSMAAGQVQVTVDDAVTALDPATWDVVLAEERSRPGGTGADAVVRAVRRPGDQASAQVTQGLGMIDQAL